MKRILCLFFLMISVVNQQALGLNLDEVLVNTYQNNNQLKSAIENLEAQNEIEVKALSEFLPQVSANYNRRLIEQKIKPAISTDHRDYAVSFTISQPLFNSGGSIAGYKKAVNQVSAVHAQFLSTEQQILLDAISSYMNVIQSEQFLELSRKNIEVLTKHLQSAEEKYQLGEATQTDVAQANSRLAAANTKYFENRGLYESAKAHFEKVVGLEAAGLEIPSMERYKEFFDLEELKRLAMNESPVIIKSKYETDAANYDIKRQVANFLPSATLNYSVAKDKNKTLAGSKALNKTVSVGVTIPIYQAGVEYSNLRATKKVYNAHRFDHKNIVSTTLERVIKSWHDHQLAIAAVESTKIAEDAAEIAARGVTQESEVGVRTMTERLDAEQDLFQAQVDAVTARIRLIMSYYSLKAVVGKLTAKGLDLNVPLYDLGSRRRANSIKIIGF